MKMKILIATLIITTIAYVGLPGSKERSLFSTRSNIVNTLGDHEFKGHFKAGFHHRKGVLDPIYKMQMKAESWKKTTKEYKDYIISTAKENGYI